MISGYQPISTHTIFCTEIWILPAVDEEVDTGADSKKKVIEAYLQRYVTWLYSKLYFSELSNVFVQIANCKYMVDAAYQALEPGRWEEKEATPAI